MLTFHKHYVKNIGYISVPDLVFNDLFIVPHIRWYFSNLLTRFMSYFYDASASLLVLVLYIVSFGVIGCLPLIGHCFRLPRVFL